MKFKIDAKEKEILRTVTIPPRPESLIKVQEEAQKDEPNFEVISKAIVADVSISGAVLQIVNSAAFRRPSKISSIDQAVMMLGLKRVVSIVNAVAIRSAAGGNQEQLQEFWSTAAEVAQACVLFCKHIGLKALEDDAYTSGLFHLAGVPLMIQTYPDYLDFYHHAELDGWNFSIEKEKSKYLTTHTTMAAILGYEWKLPLPIIEAIYNLHYAEGIFDSDLWSDKTKKLLAILVCGREVQFRKVHGQQGPEWLDFQDQILAFMDLDDAILQLSISNCMFDLQQCE
jgi:HD-like signal output (HDOD) protein